MTKADLQNIATTFLVGGLLGLPAGGVGAGIGCFVGGMVGSVASTFVNQERKCVLIRQENTNRQNAYRFRKGVIHG
ncbi:hypothetical protein [Bacillus wiedmannii]|uniref:hypothetical protein n=1 Tax=Bacillus wiedmannii TaxID=1890302 RepID=UPI003D9995C2